MALAHVIHETPKLPFGEELDVEHLQIFKEVDGIMTANPESFDAQSGNAPRTISHLTYDECVSMSRLGAQVLQQQAAEMARKYRIPVTVRNFRDATSAGTEIGGSGDRPRDDRASAIVDQQRLLVFDLARGNPRLPLQIAERLDRERLTYYRVSAQDDRPRFAVLPLKYRNVENVVRGVLDRRGAQAEVNAGDFALVSVIGESLRNRLGEWAERAQGLLRDSGVEIHGTAQGDISVSCLVPDEQRIRALSCLHLALVL